MVYNPIPQKKSELKDINFALNQAAYGMVFDSSGKIIFSNEKFATATGFPIEMLISPGSVLYRIRRRNPPLMRQAEWKLISRPSLFPPNLR